MNKLKSLLSHCNDFIQQKDNGLNHDITLPEKLNGQHRQQFQRKANTDK